MGQFARYESRWVKPGDKVVFVPDATTRAYGRILAGKIHKLWQPPGFYTHFAPGGYLPQLHEFARYHYFAKIDLSSFFPSLQKNRIARNLYRVLGSYKEAWGAAGMSCVPHLGRLILPVGFVQSPIIATLCLANSRVGSTMRDIANGQRVRIQCYFDDIVLCSNSSYQLNRAFSEICTSIEDSGLALNSNKTKNARHQITVFNIECSYAKLRVTQARLALFAEQMAGTTDPAVRSGIVDYVNSVNLVQGRELTLMRI